MDEATRREAGNIYFNLKKQAEEGVNWLIEYVNEHNTELEKSIVDATKKATEATEAAETAVKDIRRTTQRLCTIKKAGDVMYYAAPVLVFIDVLLRLAGWI